MKKKLGVRTLASMICFLVLLSSLESNFTFAARIEPQNISAGKPAKASSEYSSVYSADKVNDGIVGGITAWASKADDSSPMITIDLLDNYIITSVAMSFRTGFPENERKNYTVIASNSETFSDFVTLGAIGDAAIAEGSKWTQAVKNNATYRYVRIRKTGLDLWNTVINELEVMGYKPSPSDLNQVTLDIPYDVSGTKYEDAYRKLSPLKIMQGDEVGFRPFDMITRAEFATVVVRALGLEDTANAVKGAEVFPDVSEDHWASGYIKVAFDSGIINGFSDGKFYPSEKVAYEQAIKMLVCALGYEQAATQKGGYPLGYVIIASQEGITEDVDGVQGTFAYRGTVAQMVENSLEIPFLVRSGYGKKIRYIRSGTEGTTEQTILNTKLKYDVIKAKVIKADESNDEITLSKQDEQGNFGGDKLYKTIAGLNYNGTEGVLLTFWIHRDNNKVYYIEQDEQNDVFFDYIEKINGKSMTESFTINKADVASIRLKNSQQDYRTNGQFDLTVDESATVDQLTNDSIGKFAKVVIQDSKVRSISLFSLKEGGLITKSSYSMIQYVRGGRDRSNQFSLTDLSDIETYVIAIDGKDARYEELNTDMLFDYYVNRESKLLVISASTQKIDGVLTRAGLDKLFVDKRQVDVRNVYYSTDLGATYLNVDKAVDLLNSTITVYLDPMGYARFVQANLTNVGGGFIGYVSKAWVDDESYVKVYKLNGSVLAETQYKLDVKYDQSMVSIEQLMDSAGTNQCNYKFTLNKEGNISQIEPLSWTTLAAGNFSIDADNKKISSTLLSNADVNQNFISLYDEEGKFKPTVVNITSFKDTSYTNMTMLVGQERKDVSVVPYYASVLITGGFDSVYSSRVDNYGYGLVTDISKISDKMYEISVKFQSGSVKGMKLSKSELALVSNDTFITYATKIDGSIHIRDTRKASALFATTPIAIYSLSDNNAYVKTAGYTETADKATFKMVHSNVLVYKEKDGELEVSSLAELKTIERDGISTKLYGWTDSSKYVVLIYRDSEN